MKKSSIITLIILIVVIAAIVWFGRSPSGPETVTPGNNNSASTTSASTSPIPVTETTKVSSKTSKYENSELGFTVNYPTAWEIANSESGVSFFIPIDNAQVSSVSKIESKINVMPGKCSFPPVTTIKDRSTLKVGSLTMNMISMSNNVQGRAYFDRLYNLQQGQVCYTFWFSSITASPESKKLTGSNLVQAQNNNKAIVNTADTEFINMVKSFAFVQGPAGQDETKVTPTR